MSDVSDEKEIINSSSDEEGSVVAHESSIMDTVSIDTLLNLLNVSCAKLENCIENRDTDITELTEAIEVLMTVATSRIVLSEEQIRCILRLLLAVVSNCKALDPLKLACKGLAQLTEIPLVTEIANSEESLKSMIIKSGCRLYRLGDYETQTELLTSLLNLCGENDANNWSKMWFKDEKALDMFLSFDKDSCFERECRKLLNFINISEKGLSVLSFRAHSVYCHPMKLTSPKEYEFWIDFNTASHSISFYCISPDFHGIVETLVDWETIIINKDMISSSSLSLLPDRGLQRLDFQLNCNCFVSNDSAPEEENSVRSQERSNLSIYFWTFSNVRHILEDFYGPLCQFSGFPDEQLEYRTSVLDGGHQKIIFSGSMTDSCGENVASWQNSQNLIIGSQSRKVPYERANRQASAATIGYNSFIINDKTPEESPTLNWSIDIPVRITNNEEDNGCGDDKGNQKEQDEEVETIENIEKEVHSYSSTPTKTPAEVAQCDWRELISSLERHAEELQKSGHSSTGSLSDGNIKQSAILYTLEDENKALSNDSFIYVELQPPSQILIGTEDVYDSKKNKVDVAKDLKSLEFDTASVDDYITERAPFPLQIRGQPTKKSNKAEKPPLAVSGGKRSRNNSAPGHESSRTMSRSKKGLVDDTDVHDSKKNKVDVAEGSKPFDFDAASDDDYILERTPFPLQVKHQPIKKTTKAEKPPLAVSKGKRSRNNSASSRAGSRTISESKKDLHGDTDVHDSKKNKVDVVESSKPFDFDMSSDDDYNLERAQFSLQVRRRPMKQTTKAENPPLAVSKGKRSRNNSASSRAGSRTMSESKKDLADPVMTTSRKMVKSKRIPDLSDSSLDEMIVKNKDKMVAADCHFLRRSYKDDLLEGKSDVDGSGKDVTNKESISDVVIVEVPETNQDNFLEEDLEMNRKLLASDIRNKGSVTKDRAAELFEVITGETDKVEKSTTRTLTSGIKEKLKPSAEVIDAEDKPEDISEDSEIIVPTQAKLKSRRFMLYKCASMPMLTTREEVPSLLKEPTVEDILKDKPKPKLRTTRAKLAGNQPKTGSGAKDSSLDIAIPGPSGWKKGVVANDELTTDNKEVSGTTFNMFSRTADSGFESASNVEISKAAEAEAEGTVFKTIKNIGKKGRSKIKSVEIETGGIETIEEEVKQVSRKRGRPTRRAAKVANKKTKRLLSRKVETGDISEVDDDDDEEFKPPTLPDTETTSSEASWFNRKKVPGFGFESTKKSYSTKTGSTGKKKTMKKSVRVTSKKKEVITVEEELKAAVSSDWSSIERFELVTEKSEPKFSAAPSKSCLVGKKNDDIFESSSHSVVPLEVQEMGFGINDFEHSLPSPKLPPSVVSKVDLSVASSPAVFKPIRRHSDSMLSSSVGSSAAARIAEDFFRNPQSSKQKRSNVQNEAFASQNKRSKIQETEPMRNLSDLSSGKADHLQRYLDSFQSTGESVCATAGSSVCDSVSDSVQEFSSNSYGDDRMQTDIEKELNSRRGKAVNKLESVIRKILNKYQTTPCSSSPAPPSLLDEPTFLCDRYMINPEFFSEMNVILRRLFGTVQKYTYELRKNVVMLRRKLFYELYNSDVLDVKSTPMSQTASHRKRAWRIKKYMSGCLKAEEEMEQSIASFNAKVLKSFKEEIRSARSEAYASQEEKVISHLNNTITKCLKCFLKKGVFHSNDDNSFLA